MPSSPDGTATFAAGRTIFLPAIIVAVLYGGLWVVMMLQGRGDTALARMLLLVVLLGVPLLFARAWLRYASFGLRLTGSGIEYRQGWPRPPWEQLSFEDLSRIDVVYGPLGRFAGGVALVLICRDGRRLRLADIADPEEAASQIRRRLSLTAASAG